MFQYLVRYWTGIVDWVRGAPLASTPLSMHEKARKQEKTLVGAISKDQPAEFGVKRKYAWSVRKSAKQRPSMPPLIHEELPVSPGGDYSSSAITDYYSARHDLVSSSREPSSTSSLSPIRTVISAQSSYYSAHDNGAIDTASILTKSISFKKCIECRTWAGTTLQHRRQ